VIHADRLHDNALFAGDRLSGVLNFHFASVDDLLFDLAVTANDWSAPPGGALDESMATMERSISRIDRSMRAMHRWLRKYERRIKKYQHWLGKDEEWTRKIEA
jgi:aminoglycoside phosphotransferase (APT) family kinase protein